MPRSPLAALLLALPLVACTSRDVSIVPDPEWHSERREAQIGGAEVSFPRPSSGVLPPGAADAVVPAGSPPVVKLLDAGAAPRSELRYTLVKGASQRVAMSMDMAVGVKAQGQSMPSMPMPRMTFTFDTTAVDRSADGDLKIEAHLAAAAVDPAGGQQEQMARALRPQLDAMKGLGMSFRVSATGHVHDDHVDLPANAPPGAQQLMAAMAQAFEGMITPLPQEAVGAGARWQVVSRLATGGADILQSSVYTLKSRSPARAALDVTVVQLAARDTLHTPQMPPAMTAQIKSFSSAGTGGTQVDLKSVAPESGTLSLKTGMEIVMPAAGGGGPDEQSLIETTTSVTLSRP